MISSSSKQSPAVLSFPAENTNFVDLVDTKDGVESVSSGGCEEKDLKATLSADLLLISGTATLRPLSESCSSSSPVPPLLSPEVKEEGYDGKVVRRVRRRRSSDERDGIILTEVNEGVNYYFCPLFPSLSTLIVLLMFHVALYATESG